MMPITKLRRYRKLLTLLLFVAALIATVQLTGLRDHWSPQYLQQQLQENIWSGLALFTLLFAVSNLAQIPGWIFLAAAVYEFGRAYGGLATYVAANISCFFTFYVVRLVGGNVTGLPGNTYTNRLLAELHTNPIRNIVILRTLFQTLPALNYALALSGIGLRKYLLGTLLGLPLPIAAYCIFFDYLVTMAHKV